MAVKGFSGGVDDKGKDTGKVRDMQRRVINFRLTVPALPGSKASIINGGRSSSGGESNTFSNYSPAPTTTATPAQPQRRPILVAERRLTTLVGRQLWVATGIV